MTKRSFERDWEREFRKIAAELPAGGGSFEARNFIDSVIHPPYLSQKYFYIPGKSGCKILGGLSPKCS